MNRGFQTEFSTGFNILRDEPIPASLLKDTNSKDQVVAESARKVVHKLAERATCKKHFVTRCYHDINASAVCPAADTGFNDHQFDCIKTCEPNKIPYPIVCCDKTGAETIITPICPLNGDPADWDSAKAMCENNNQTLCDLHDIWRNSTTNGTDVPYINVRKLCANTDMDFTLDAEAEEMIDAEPQLPFWTSTCCVPETTSTTTLTLPSNSHFIARGCYGCNEGVRYCHSVCEPREARLGGACCDSDTDTLADVYSACPFRRLGATLDDVHGYCQEFQKKPCSVKQLADFIEEKKDLVKMINASAADRATGWIPEVGGAQDVVQPSSSNDHEIDYNDNDTDGCGGETNNFERFMMWTDVPCDPPRTYNETVKKLNSIDTNKKWASALWFCRCNPNSTVSTFTNTITGVGRVTENELIGETLYQAMQDFPTFGPFKEQDHDHKLNLAVCGYYDDQGVRQCEVHDGGDVTRADEICHAGLTKEPGREAPKLGCYDIVVEGSVEENLQSIDKYNEFSKYGMHGMLAAWDYNFAMPSQGSRWQNPEINEINKTDADGYNASWINLPTATALLRAKSSISHSTSHVKVASPSGATRCQPLSARFAAHCCNRGTEKSRSVCSTLTGTNFKSADRVCQSLGSDWGLCSTAALHRGIATNSGCNIADNVTMYWTNAECNAEEHDEFLKVSSSILLRGKQVAKAKRQFYGGKDAIY